MLEPAPEFDTPAKQNLPAAQKTLLITLLVGYPALSILMNLGAYADSSNLSSRISQVYLPSLTVQLLMLAVILLVLWRTRTTLAEIGLSRDDINWSNALSGVIFFVGAWTVIIILRSAIQSSGFVPEKNFLYLLPRSGVEKIFWVILSLGAAFSEEITFRGFIISRFRILTGRDWHGALLSSLVFGLGHLYQGLAGVILTFTYGILFAGLYLARRSIFPCIVAHFLQDALILLAIRA
jgi:membrane protease YdiL (CAAX protease family)